MVKIVNVGNSTTENTKAIRHNRANAPIRHEKNKESNKARLVAGYCWKWFGKKNPQVYDVVIPEHDFKMRWNLDADSSLWIVAPTSVDEVGCIHTSQGLEVDYIGVIVGPDFVVRNGVVVTRPNHRASSDKSLSGYKKWARTDPIAANEAADLIIKNTYRTLMTRGMKGCFVYCTDQETEEYFRSRLGAVQRGRLVAAPSDAAETTRAAEATPTPT